MQDGQQPRFAADDARDGVSGHQLERAATRGDVERIRHGAYLDAGAWSLLSARQRHLARIAAARRAAREEPVFSHRSAAVLHGIPFLGEPPPRPCTTVPPGASKSSGSVERRRRELDTDDVVELPDGTRVTSPTRTAMDLAAGGSSLGGIIAFSHVRRFHGVDRARIDARLVRAGVIPGVRAARVALRRSTADSESALETLVVVRCEDLGFEPPAQQLPIVGVDGRAYRIDFAWDGGRILLESDGRGKYADPALLRERTTEEVIWAERLRENAIRPSCERFLRATWADAWRGTPLASLLAAAGVPRPRRARALTR